ncbi:MAG: hypothetical protein J1E16_05905 [Muribaculaceae bacterium]|nr:hypothetical protein [Muribaculaceae bacterium]
MRVNKRLVEIYVDEFNDLLENLSMMVKEDRDVLFKTHSKRLFPKSKEIVNLEDQLKGRSDYIHKFKRSFFIIGNCFFSSNYFGEYNQEEFIKRTGYQSQRYPQKVILALSLMGYITKMRRSYSVAHHGYQYEIDYWKFKKWDKDFFVDIDLDEEKETPCSIPDFGDEWLYRKQIETFKAMEVDEVFFSDLMKEKDEALSNYSKETVSKSKNLNHINDMETLYHRKEGLNKIIIDGQDGRLYSIMTRMKSDYRHGGILSIDGEKFKEVDLSNSQPTLLGLMVKRKLNEKNQEFNSLWLEHAVKGDFYEWLVDITGIGEMQIDDIILKLEEVIDKNKKSKKKHVREQAKEDENIINKVKREISPYPHVKLRPLVKYWIIKFLFGKQIVCPDNKDVKGIERKFLKNLCVYLNANEPYIYEELIWYKKHPQPKKKNPCENASELARKLQEEEVRYIKECLKRLDTEVKYLYTVHDCIGCLVSDVDKVKSIMEQTSIDYYGVKLNLKVE